MGKDGEFDGTGSCAEVRGMELFGRGGDASRSRIRQELEATYCAMLQQQCGVAPGEARAMVRDMLNKCEAQGQAEKTAWMSGEYGAFLLREAEAGRPYAVEIVRKARADGARDEDIQEWWSLDDLQRRMVLWSENVFRYASFAGFRKQGASPDEAMANVRSLFPMYGDPDDTEHVTGDDRPLPNELRGRVDEHRSRLGAQAVLERSKGSPTFNAFVRSEIRGGHL